MIKKYCVRWGGAVFFLLMSCGFSQASPWAAVGDMQLRNDVEILARHGIVSGPVNTWPISWKQITRNLSTTSEMDLPPYVRLAAMRVREKIPGEFRVSARVQATNNPAIVRGFATTARNDLDADATLEYNNSDSGTTIHLQGGYRKGNGEDYTHLDGSYLSQDMGNWSAYAGAFDRWWGPGRESTLIMSNNARPMPSVGLRRIEPKAFETKWLSWMGPWQWDMFVARMEEERFVPNALIVGMRLNFEPVERLDIGFSRILQLCGNYRPCGLKTWGNSFIGLFDADNQGSSDEPGNQLASIDLSYTFPLGSKQNVKIYAEGTAEDQTVLVPYQFSKLLGLSIFAPYGSHGSNWRLSAEFVDTKSNDAWLFGASNLNVLYEHVIYKTGYRYKGRVIGADIDSDSKKTTLKFEFTSLANFSYDASWSYLELNRDNDVRHTVSISEKKIHLLSLNGRLKISVGELKAGVHYQSDRPHTPMIRNDLWNVSFVWTVSY